MSPPRAVAGSLAVALGVVVSAGAVEESPVHRLATILARRGAEPVEAEFRQTKHVALLRDPLESRGRLLIVLPDGLRWEVIEPQPLVVDTRGGRVRTGPPGDLREVPEAMLGPLSTLPGGFSGVLGARAEEIVEAFEVADGDGPGSFRLKPKDPDLARVLASIELDLDPETGIPRRVVLHEAGGDLSEIEIIVDSGSGAEHAEEAATAQP